MYLPVLKNKIYLNSMYNITFGKLVLIECLTVLSKIIKNSNLFPDRKILLLKLNIAEVAATRWQ